ncbi:MAG: hypothetical protein ACXWUG_10325 [Polyangiales bacterium]
MKRLSFVLFGLALSCGGGDPPGTVDEESVALDIPACAKHETDCVTKGTLPVELVVPGSTSALSLPSGASISGTLQRPFDGKLMWLALGSHADGKGKLQIQIGDGAPIVIRPASWFSRIEVGMDGVQPAKGALVTFTAIDGTVDLAWVIGRWTR